MYVRISVRIITRYRVFLFPPVGKRSTAEIFKDTLVSAGRHAERALDHPMNRGIGIAVLSVIVAGIAHGRPSPARRLPRNENLVVIHVYKHSGESSIETGENGFFCKLD